jgi:threonine synthase
MNFICLDCATVISTSSVRLSCNKCGGLLEWMREDEVTVSSLLPPPQDFNLWRYSALLPRVDEEKIVSLSEGGTPLHFTENLAEHLGIEELFVKNEGKNPTGSFKDRGMSVALTVAKATGVRIAMCASTGNTASSMAAYGAKAGIPTVVVVPRGKVAKTKLAQCVAYGARVIETRGNFDQALEIVKENEGTDGTAIMNSVNPFRIEGQKTAAFEICDQLSAAPDWLVIPVGNGGNISSYWKGFREFRSIGVISELPKIVAVQAEGASPIVHAYEKGLSSVQFIESPETEASAIRIGKPANWKRALSAVRESAGLAISVTDREITEARKLLAEKEGILAELASASTVAAVRKLSSRHLFKPGETVVCVATGNGLKDVGVPGDTEAAVISTADELRKILMTI